LDRLISADHTF